MWLISFVVLSAVPPFAADVPEGSDLAMRLETGLFGAATRAFVDDLQPVLEAWPGPTVELAAALARGRAVLTDLAALCGAQLEQRQAVATVSFDLDAAGGVVWSAVVRGPLAEPRAAPTGTSAPLPFTIDGQAAWRAADRDLAWIALDAQTLVVGCARGVQRQLRWLVGRHHDHPLTLIAKRLRTPAPVMIAFLLPEAVRVAVAGLAPPVTELYGQARSGALSARPGRLELQLASDDEAGRAALAHGVRAALAAVRASGALLDAGSQAVLGLDRLGKRPPSVPEPLGPEVVATLGRWLDGFTFSASLHERPAGALEVAAEVSSFPGLAAAALAAAAVGLEWTRAPAPPESGP